MFNLTKTPKRALQIYCAMQFGIGCASFCHAQDQLGPLNNLLLKNPYLDAASGQFGSGVVAGDFDGDGIDDLAVSENGGARLRVMFGQNGVVGSITIPFLPITVDMPSHNFEMVSGDFDGDGRDEIAVGASGTSTNGNSAAGGVYVIKRATNGTWSVENEIRAGGVYPGSPQEDAFLGDSLTVGDFDNDGFTDLAIGIQGQTVSGATNAGAVMVTYGGILGITGAGAQLFNRNNDGLSFTPRQGDFFGTALAAGDFDNDGDDDLAIGISNALCPNGTTEAGAVVVMNGSASGVTSSQSSIRRPGTLGVLGNCEDTRGFGRALASGDFNRDFYADLAIGAPTTVNLDSAVHVLYGSETGLSNNNDQRLTAPSFAGGDSDFFGSALATGRLAYHCEFIFCNGDSLVIGASLATVNGIDNAGLVWVIDSPIGGGLDINTAKPILPQAPLLVGGAHTNDRFGSALAVGDFNDDQRVDLAIGVPQYDDGPTANAGSVQVLFQYQEVTFSDGFEE